MVSSIDTIYSGDNRGVEERQQERELFNSGVAWSIADQNIYMYIILARIPV